MGRGFHFIRINPAHISKHLKEGFNGEKKYEVAAVDHQNRILYVYNDSHNMIPIQVHHCIEIPDDIFESSYTGGYELL
jgi:hypothetical protein